MIPKTAKEIDDVSDPLDIVKHLLEVVDHEELLELYEIPDFSGHIEFLENISKTNKLMIRVIFFFILNFRKDILMLRELPDL